MKGTRNYTIKLPQKRLKKNQNEKNKNKNIIIRREKAIKDKLILKNITFSFSIFFVIHIISANNNNDNYNDYNRLKL